MHIFQYIQQLSHDNFLVFRTYLFLRYELFQSFRFYVLHNYHLDSSIYILIHFVSLNYVLMIGQFHDPVFILNCQLYFILISSYHLSSIKLKVYFRYDFIQNSMTTFSYFLKFLVFLIENLQFIYLLVPSIQLLVMIFTIYILTLSISMLTYISCSINLNIAF